MITLSLTEGQAKVLVEALVNYGPAGQEGTLQAVTHQIDDQTAKQGLQAAQATSDLLEKIQDTDESNDVGTTSDTTVGTAGTTIPSQLDDGSNAANANPIA